MHPIFAQIIKVDEERREVTGRAAQEVVDRDNELFDYKSSKPEFMKWSAEVSADTNGKSLGNIRSMHGNVAAGKVTNIDFNDVEKAIDITAKIVDNNEWEKVMEGVHTGFSIGGRYARKWAEPINGKMVQRYTAVPSEISIVDRPCIPTAKFFSIHKRDGSIEKRMFASAIEFVDGKIMLKGGPGSGPHGGGGGGKYDPKELDRQQAIKNHATMARRNENSAKKEEAAGRNDSADAHRVAAAAHRAAGEAHENRASNANKMSLQASKLGMAANSGSQHPAYLLPR